MQAIHNLLAAIILAGLFATISGTAFADSHLPPLHLAAQQGDFAEVKRLINGGANVNEKTDISGVAATVAGTGYGGETPLYFAKTGEIALALIEAGADISAQNSKKMTPLHFARSATAPVIIKAGADVNAKDGDGYTPLHWIAHGHDVETAFILVKAGADLHARTNSKSTPLDLAIFFHEIAYGRTDTGMIIFLRGAMEKPLNKNRQKAEELLRKLE